MSDWIDLQLAHSLTRVQAPDDLWDRIMAPPPVRRPFAVRWAVPTGIAACVMALTAMPHELYIERPDFSAPVVERKLAHEARPAASPIKSVDVSCQACHS